MVSKLLNGKEKIIPSLRNNLNQVSDAKPAIARAFSNLSIISSIKA